MGSLSSMAVIVLIGILGGNDNSNKSLSYICWIKRFEAIEPWEKIF